MHIEVITGSEMRHIPQPDGVVWPEDSLHVIARSENGGLEARMSLIAIPHIEGTWIAESLRGTTAGARLLARMEQEVRNLGRSHIFAFIKEEDKKVAEYMERSGYTRYPLSVYVKEL